MRVECPNCGAKGEIDELKRPPGTTAIRCPGCKQSIPLELPEAVADRDRTSAPQVPPSSGIHPETDTASRCAMCGNEFPREDMVRFGPSLVCAACKPTYVQMLEQGASRPGELRYAAFGSRFGAKLVDGLLLFVVNMCISFLFGLAVATNKPPSSLIALKGVEFLLEITIGVTMVTYFLGKFGATPGKMALGLVVVTPEGGKISYLRAFGRYFAEMLSSICLGIGYLMVLFDEEKRAMHDRICNTRVVHK